MSRYRSQININPDMACPYAYNMRNGFASAAWPSADLAVFVPFWVPENTLITELAVYNGASVSGNIDIGIYSLDGTRIVSAGSVAQSGTNARQAFDVTDTVIASGAYYVAVAMDNTTGTTFRATNSGFATGFALLGHAEMSSAFPLPATAILATSTAAYCPYYSITGVSG